MYNNDISVSKPISIEFEKMTCVKNIICCMPGVVGQVMK